MYVSHPVRRMRDDPMADEEVALVVTPEEAADAESLEDPIEATGATVAERLDFGALRVRIEEAAVEGLCELDGIESIETADVVGYTGDAGEDLD